MELYDAIGSRRSYRFLQPDKPVEQEKIQKMLEAARLASFWGNVCALRAVVVDKFTATPEQKEALFALVQGWQLQRAPVVIVWWLDWQALEEQGDRLKELVRCRATGVDEEAAIEHLDTQLIPFFEAVRPHIMTTGLTEFDCGQGVAQATLVAMQEGLGCCCLGTPNEDKIKAALGLPDSGKVIVLQCVGYPAEGKEAGGQRPRLPFERMYALNSSDTPFPRDAKVVEELEETRMLQTPSPLPDREAELQRLKKELDLPDDA